MTRQKPISIKIPDQILILIDNFVRLERFDSRSHFLRIAIEELLKQELGTWEKLVDQIEKSG
ncbi:MAG: ribbon-helix-helix protein, CopG family [Candidatus Heimdallarchaeota archaeon]|nr:MAG: ribbon-helix-helix protein, CopG family [Candidatus Heimdallarchaeota archaeon]